MISMAFSSENDTSLVGAANKASPVNRIGLAKLASVKDESNLFGADPRLLEDGSVLISEPKLLDRVQLGSGGPLRNPYRPE
jgi:hypothetical protein